MLFPLTGIFPKHGGVVRFLIVTKIIEGHTKLDQIGAPPRQALIAEVQKATKLYKQARYSAAVGRRLVEEGSNFDLCTLAGVSAYVYVVAVALLPVYVCEGQYPCAMFAGLSTAFYRLVTVV